MLGLILASNCAAQTGVLVPTTIKVASKTDIITARDTNKMRKNTVINLSQLARSAVFEKVILSDKYVIIVLEEI